MEKNKYLVDGVILDSIPEINWIDYSSYEGLYFFADMGGGCKGVFKGEPEFTKDWRQEYTIKSFNKLVFPCESINEVPHHKKVVDFIECQDMITFKGSDVPISCYTIELDSLKQKNISKIFKAITDNKNNIIGYKLSWMNTKNKEEK